MFRVIEGEGTATLFLGTEVSLGQVEELHAALLALCAGGRSLTIDAAEVERLHTGVVQLLLAFERSAAGRIAAPSAACAAIFERLGARAPA